MFQDRSLGIPEYQGFARLELTLFTLNRGRGKMKVGQDPHVNSALTFIGIILTPLHGIFSRDRD